MLSFLRCHPTLPPPDKNQCFDGDVGRDGGDAESVQFQPLMGERRHGVAAEAVSCLDGGWG